MSKALTQMSGGLELGPSNADSIFMFLAKRLLKIPFSLVNMDVYISRIAQKSLTLLAHNGITVLSVWICGFTGLQGTHLVIVLSRTKNVHSSVVTKIKLP